MHPILKLSLFPSHQVASQIAVAMPPGAQPFRLMDLPTELRLTIYKFALSTPKDDTLRPLKDLEIRRSRYGQWVVRLPQGPKIRNIGILMASKNVLTEALPVFYQINRFHYSILPTVASVKCTLPHFLLHLHLMQHVSIDYMFHSAASEINQIDRILCSRIQSIVDGCPTLRTFTLHLLTFWKADKVHIRLSAGSQTAFELSRLAARLENRTQRLEWISVVVHSDSCTLVDLLSGVAPISDWKAHVATKWPCISIDGYQKEAMERRQDGDASQKIRMYRLSSALRGSIQDRLRYSRAVVLDRAIESWGQIKG